MTSIAQPHRKTSWAAFLVRWESVLVAAFLALVFLANCLTTYEYGIFFEDDVLLSDPGANLATGHGFTSTAWFAQRKDEVFAGNLPLYPLALAGWVKLFGFGHLQLRAFSYLCGIGVIFLLWKVVRSQHWLTSVHARLALVFVMAFAFPVFKIYRHNRYDVFQALLSVLVLAVWTAALPRRYKLPLLFFLSAAVSLSGFQSGFYVALVACLAVLVERGEALRNAAAVIAGVGSGAAAFLAYCKWQGILHGLIGNKKFIGEVEGPASWAFIYQRMVPETLRDTGIVLPLALLLVLCTARFGSDLRQEVRLLARWALIATLVIMAGLEFFLHFLEIYRWMTFLPLIVLALAALERAWPELTSARRRAALALLLLLVLAGFPTALLYGWFVGHGRHVRALEAMIAGEITPGDIAIAEYQAYCPLRERAALVYYPGYLSLLQDRERTAVSALIVRTISHGGVYYLRYGTFVDWMSRDGSRWTKTAEVVPVPSGLAQWLLPRCPPKVQLAFQRRLSRYQIGFYRRESAQEQPVQPPAE